jgi:hypothetical protein
MLMLNKTPAAVTNSVIALLPVWRANRSTGSFPDDFVEPGKWFRRGLAIVAAEREAASRFGSDIQSWSRLFEQNFRLDKWNLCRG